MLQVHQELSDELDEKVKHAAWCRKDLTIYISVIYGCLFLRRPEIIGANPDFRWVMSLESPSDCVLGLPHNCFVRFERLLCLVMFSSNSQIQPRLCGGREASVTYAYICHVHVAAGRKQAFCKHFATWLLYVYDVAWPPLRRITPVHNTPTFSRENQENQVHKNGAVTGCQ